MRLIERKQLKNRLILAKNEQYYWTNGSTKHDMGYKPEWEAEFPWLIPEKNSIGEVTGTLCRKFATLRR